MDYVFDWSVVVKPELWLNAMGVTLAYGLASTFAGLLLGLLLGLALLSRSRFARWPINLFVGIFRCTPALVQIVWFYYAFPIVLSVNMPAWLAAGLGLTLYMAAFSTEIFRGGIEKIEKGQWYASRSLCLPYWKTMYYVILPQTFRRMTAPLVNQSIIQFKNTSLLSVISVHDIMYTADSLTAATYRPLEILTFASLLYIVLIWPLATLAVRVERSMNQKNAT